MQNYTLKKRHIYKKRRNSINKIHSKSIKMRYNRDNLTGETQTDTDTKVDG